MHDISEITLHHGDWTAVVSSHGASLRGVTHRGATVVTGYRGAAGKQGGQGDVLIPFPGRVKGGRYHWDGESFRLPLTDKDGPNAIHGFVRKMDWSLVASSAAGAVFELRMPAMEGYPFPLNITVAYALDGHGLRCDCSIVNAGQRAAPVSMGFHPYFSVGSRHIDADTLTLPFAEVLEFESLIPTGRVLSVEEAGLDFRTPRLVGATKFNHCFIAPERDEDGLVRVRLSQGDTALTVWMDQAFTSVVMYTGEALPSPMPRTSLAIEPMSGGSDAFNHPEWGLVRLEPGAELRGAWGVVQD